MITQTSQNAMTRIKAVLRFKFSEMAVKPVAKRKINQQLMTSMEEARE